MKLPNSWGEVTIAQYLKIHTITEKIVDPLERGIQIIAALTGKPVKEVEQLKVNEINEMVVTLDFLKALPSERLPLEFKLKGRKFKAIIFQHEMTAAQFIDYSSVCKTVTTNDALVYEMHNLLGCFCVEGKRKLFNYKYEYQGYNKLGEFFYDNMPLSIAYPFFVFFCNVWLNLLPPMQDYFQQQALMNLQKARNKITELVN